MLILDEPTSGVDPMARDRFWELLIELSRNKGVTIFVSTHFMNEAARCDRIALMDAGRVLATGTRRPDRARGASNLKMLSFPISRKRSDTRVRCRESRSRSATPARRPRAEDASTANFLVSLRRMFAYTIRESLELLRDPDPARLRADRHGISDAGLWVRHHDRCRTSLVCRARSRQDAGKPRLSRGTARIALFLEKAAAQGVRRTAEPRLKSGTVKATIEIPPGFGRDMQPPAADRSRRLDRRRHAVPGRDHPRLSAGRAPAVSRRSAPSAATPRSPARRTQARHRSHASATIRILTASTPWCRRTMALLLALIPAILMALAIVREKELGSITNLYVTPVTRLEFLLGKQLPYIAVGDDQFRHAVSDGGLHLRGAVQGKLSRALRWARCSMSPRRPPTAW